MGSGQVVVVLVQGVPGLPGLLQNVGVEGVLSGGEVQAGEGEGAGGQLQALLCRAALAVAPHDGPQHACQLGC